MKRSNKFQLIVGLLVITAAILACGSSSDVQINTPSGNNNQQNPTSTSQAGTTRSNPAPVGSEVVVDNMAFQILNIIRPADSIVQSGNMLNSTPEPGKEYLFVEIQVTCKKTMDEKCSFSPEFSSKLIGSNGIEYDPEIFIAGVDRLLSSTEFYGNAVISGYLPFIVGVGETGFVFVYAPLLGDNFYLAIQ